MKKLILISTLALSTTSFANEDHYSDCLEKAGVTNEGVMELCAEKASNAYKKSITKSYNAIFSYYQKNEPKKSKPFEDAQKAWLANRNKSCEISDNKPQCLLKFNQQRSEELAQLQLNVENKATNESLDAYYSDCTSQGGGSGVVAGCLEGSVEAYRKEIAEYYKKFNFEMNEELLAFGKKNFAKFIESKCYLLNRGYSGMEIDLCQTQELEAHLKFLQKALSGSQ